MSVTDLFFWRHQESEEPVVDCHVLDSDISPCRTGSSSVTSGDLGDISSLSSKASSLQHSSGGTSSSTGFTKPDFIMPPSRGAGSIRYRRCRRRRLWTPSQILAVPLQFWGLSALPVGASCMLIVFSDFLTPSFLSDSLIPACFGYKLLPGINLGYRYPQIGAWAT